MSRSFQSLAHLRPLPLDFDVCYRALCSRDARFDGQFFTAVTSTGIYCRPICPAPTPKAAHVRFFASGFASLRQFNETMRATFGCPPSALRRRGRPENPGGGGLTVRLQYRPPFDAEALLAFLGQRALAGVEEVSAGRYRRTVALPRSTGIVELEPNRATQEIVMHLWLTDLRDVSLLVQRCRHLLDLDAEPTTIAGQLSADPLLASLVARRPGLRVPGTLNGFELAVRAIIGQHVSIAGARTLVGRLVQALGEPLPRPVDTLTHLFPAPERMAQANLQALGLTARRATALRALAEGVATGAIVLDRGQSARKP